MTEYDDQPVYREGSVQRPAQREAPATAREHLARAKQALDEARRRAAAADAQRAKARAAAAEAATHPAYDHATAGSIQLGDWMWVEHRRRWSQVAGSEHSDSVIAFTWADQGFDEPPSRYDATAEVYVVRAHQQTEEEVR